MTKSYEPGRVGRQRHEIGDFELQSGEVIHDFAVSYVVHGEPAQADGRTVLVTSSIAGDAHRLDFLIGAGQALDPERHLIVCADAIGNGHTTSPSTSRRQPGLRFPRFSIADMVAAQARLLRERFGVEQLLAVVGASMGGMQALQWAVARPAAMQGVVALVPLARTPPWTRAVNEVSRRILLSDPAWTGDGFAGPPQRAWRAWIAFMQAIVSRTPPGLAVPAPTAEALQAWLDELEQAWLTRAFDPIDWLYQTWAYDGHDVAAGDPHRGDLAHALASVRAQVLVLGPPLDLYNPVEAQRAAAHAIPNGRFVEIPSLQGHFASNAGTPEDVAFMNRVIAAFMRELGEP